MFEISIQREFCAAHALLIGGHREIMHGHNWRVTVVIAGGNLDADGLLCDFHTAEDVLSEVVGPFNNANLNECPPFVNGVNPSAEHIAKYIGEEMAARLDEALRPHARVVSVSITEAPGCVATYRLARAER